MSKEIEIQIERIPVLKNLMHFLKKVKLSWLNNISLYELLEMYIVGIAEGALSYRAGAIAFSFFMALFPFALFILNLSYQSFYFAYCSRRCCFLWNEE